MIHFARRQSPNLSSGILVRTAGPAASILPSLRREISAMDPEMVPFQLTTMAEETHHSLLPVRAGATILAGLGAFTVFLAAVGLYGLIAYSVSRRTREIGTRIALGATPSGIVRQVLGEGSKLLLFGTVVGFALSLAVGRLLESLLYGIGSFDVLSFAAAIAAVSLVVLAANTIPAFTASRVDPIRALKVD
jgi:putative ABC transport system permease protein